MAEFTLRGIIPPVPTIFTEHNRFDAAGQARLLDHLIAAKVDGVLILGSGGEFCHMPAAMRLEVAEFCIRHVAGRVPVMIGIGAPGTLDTIAYGRHAQKAGADAALVINPYYAHLSERNLFLHYEQVAHAVDLPLMIYNFPNLSGQDVGPDMALALTRRCENIIGIKDTVEQIAHTRRLIQEVKSVRPEFLVFAGFDEQVLNALILGGDGGIPATVNFAPQLGCGLFAAFTRGDYAAAFEKHRAIAGLAPIYDIETPFFAVIKEAIRRTGLDISPAVLPPGRPLTAEATDKVVQVLHANGLV
ncbi:MAG: dihydrodipicolinate synthase family protein [Acetobacteraceae bacterium]|nr:dihydrodipicolinate synthase family protein [Acetobacteraceae bacterium]